ncbi:hypothetical protein DERF_007378 [Dermatophagoides farinae]|uniref:Uncharacterized protein n=1 Tax=Dermatophagoides farinae TaxID=6954 RepID=A0A922HZ98_DERFA|nr:hypothetical protein DERF_007378 [Dermatophagoides farinae]
MISSTNETFSRPNNRSNIRFRHCIRPPDYYSTKWPILWMLCYSSILFISIEPIDGSITQEVKCGNNYPAMRRTSCCLYGCYLIMNIHNIHEKKENFFAFCAKLNSSLSTP